MFETRINLNKYRRWYGSMLFNTSTASVPTIEDRVYKAEHVYHDRRWGDTYRVWLSEDCAVMVPQHTLVRRRD